MSNKSWSLKNVPSQQGKIAIVTGANVGLGYETALALAGKDMKVILACRNMTKAENAKNLILQQYAHADIECMELDLSSLAAVHSFADSYQKKYETLDLLVNNAGIMVPPFSLTVDGFESQMAANYFGHFLLTQLLLNTITNTPNARVVSLSSLAHTRGKIDFDDLQSEKKYSAFKAYAQSKLACLIFAIELQRRFEKARSSAISVAAHPGISDTELSRYLPKWSMLILPFFAPFISHKPAKGALPTLRACLDMEVKGGEYYGPGGNKEYKGPPVKVKPRKMAMDPALGARLWQVSEELTGGFPSK